jgi:hypothetical protein
LGGIPLVLDLFPIRRSVGPRWGFEGEGEFEFEFEFEFDSEP